MSNKKGMLFGSFVADSLSLGVHWIYNTRAIDKKTGEVKGPIAPIAKTFHPNRGKGEFTHYGDQTLLLLQSIAENGGFDGEIFFDRWARTMREYDGYMDHATKDTLANYSESGQFGPSGSSSTDLGGAARIAPIIYTYADAPHRCLTFAEEQTRLTHNTSEVIASARFFSQTTMNVLQGQTPGGALDAAAGKLEENSPLLPLLKSAEKTVSADTRETIASFGQACSVKMAFPGTIHLILTYENDLKTALSRNAEAGGDSSARGLLAGMVLGAYLGEEKIPESWLNELKAGKEISSLCEKIDG